MLRQFGFLKTTAIGGVLLLLPLIVIGALIGQAVPIVIAVADMLGKVIPQRTANRVVIYLPGAPDPCSGQVVLVDAHRVAPADIEFGAAIDLCKRLGRPST